MNNEISVTSEMQKVMSLRNFDAAIQLQVYAHKNMMDIRKQEHLEKLRADLQSERNLQRSRILEDGDGNIFMVKEVFYKQLKEDLVMRCLESTVFTGQNEHIDEYVLYLKGIKQERDFRVYLQSSKLSDSRYINESPNPPAMLGRIG